DRLGNVARLSEEGAEWIVFSSASAVENFDSKFDLIRICNKHNIKIASIGPQTTKALVEVGVSPQVEAKVFADSGLVDALCAFVKDS
ncbi:MAG TPA: HemD protein, partial [Verrucomicrobiales bacterium]|nr:HemD protein [Verrucomicrobiales bacterium]